MHKWGLFYLVSFLFSLFTPLAAKDEKELIEKKGDKKNILLLLP